MCAATQVLSVQVMFYHTRTFYHVIVEMNHMYMFCCFSCVVEDVEEAFVKTPDSRPLLLYLRTGDRKGEKEEVSTLSPSTRDLLERVNKADKSAKLKVISNDSYGFKNSVVKLLFYWKVIRVLKVLLKLL